jgi:predicted RNase H-like HicB family nuclease
MNNKKQKILAQFTLDYWKDNGGYVGKLREVPSVFSQGETLGELIENIQDAYSMVVRESRKTIPVRDYHSKKVSLVH